MHRTAQIWVLFLWIQTVTLVKSQDCTLEEFVNSKFYDANFDISSLGNSYRNGQQATVSCTEGYGGFFQLICVRGKWQARGSKCRPQHCPLIYVDSNVQVNGSTEESIYGSVLQFSCKSNSQVLLGPENIYCGENGEWSDDAPKCGEITCPKHIDANAVCDREREDVFKYDARVICDCKEGFWGRYTLTCRERGWIGYQACRGITCPLGNVRYTVRNAVNLDPKYTYYYNERVKFACTVGYRGSPYRVCKETGWIGDSQCTEITCPRHIDGKAVCDRETQDEFRYNDQISCNCKEGFRGRYTLTCRERGWIGYQACREITCPRHIDENAVCDRETQDEFKHNDQVNCNCKEGFRGRYTVSCGEHGWTRYRACTRITCPLGNIRYAVRNAAILYPKFRYYYNETVKFACTEGYRGSPYRVCTETGWIGDSQCTVLGLR